MGSRANVAIRLNGAWTHHGSNSMGYSVAAWLALGPAPALAVFRSFPVWDPGDWQHESICEAGALIDLDAKDLLFFLNAGYGERLAALAGYQRTWPGWTIRWAYNGIADVTDALGLDRAVLDRDPWDNTDLFKWGRADPGEPLNLSYLVTVGNTAYGLDGWAESPWQIGPALLDQLADRPQPSTWPEVPRGGMHLDPAMRQAAVWSIDPVLGLADRFAERWPGWTLDFLQDRYGEQQNRSAGAFRFPEPLPAADFAHQVVKQWVVATTECSDVRPPGYLDADPLNGMGDAGLSIADLQRLGDLLGGPGQAPLDVAGYARRLHDR